MRGARTRQFKKMFDRLPSKSQRAAQEAMERYLMGDLAGLRLHKLTGQWRGFSSISAGGDLRVHFEIIVEDDTALFVAVGTHSQLYK